MSTRPDLTLLDPFAADDCAHTLGEIARRLAIRDQIEAESDALPPPAPRPLAAIARDLAAAIAEGQRQVRDHLFERADEVTAEDAEQAERIIAGNPAHVQDSRTVGGDNPWLSLGKSCPWAGFETRLGRRDLVVRVGIIECRAVDANEPRSLTQH